MWPKLKAPETEGAAVNFSLYAAVSLSLVMLGITSVYLEDIAYNRVSVSFKMRCDFMKACSYALIKGQHQNL